MERDRYKTAKYQVFAEADGNCYRFFCEASGAAVCTSSPIRADTSDEELRIAWEDAGSHALNLCHKCGKWVCNTMYNADVLECVDCSPWEAPPHFCPECGFQVYERDVFCEKCGVRLQYGGTEK